MTYAARELPRYLWFDEQPVPETGFDTLDPELWLPLLSNEGVAHPETALEKIMVLTRDEAGFRRATVAGILLCTRRPDRWLPNAVVTATRYHGTDRTTGQVDAQEITGPLPRQIADAVTFAVRNMHVAARKTPMRVDMPQYSKRAIFEAVVNAVAHRDYSMRGSRIRLSMFSDRLEIQSPGGLHNTLDLESIATRQATRNEAIASLMGWMGVGEIPGSAHRRYFMERRGDGVPTIMRATRELAGRPPTYRLIGDAEVLLQLPAAPLDATSSRVKVTVTADGQPLRGAEVLALFPNGRWKRAVADDQGQTVVDLYTADLPMTVFCAAHGHAARLVRQWLPGFRWTRSRTGSESRRGKRHFPRWDWCPARRFRPADNQSRRAGSGLSGRLEPHHRSRPPSTRPFRPGPRASVDGFRRLGALLTARRNGRALGAGGVSEAGAWGVSAEAGGIDTTFLRGRIVALEVSLQGVERRRDDDVGYDMYRTACVKEFELVLEQSGKLLRKRLAAWFASNRQADRLHFKDLFRHAARHGQGTSSTVTRSSGGFAIGTIAVPARSTTGRASRRARWGCCRGSSMTRRPWRP